VNTKQNQKPTVLVVDDEATNIDIFYELLKNDYRVLAAMSGVAAIEIANSEEKPDMVLLDINMPDLDGYEVCRLIKENEKTQDIAVIFVTSANQFNDEIKGFALGAADFILKPIHPTITLARVKTHLELIRKLWGLKI
jgi:putative two-component system response regulator